MADNLPSNNDLNVIIITYRMKDNQAFRPMDEVLLKLIFKRGGIKYGKRIFLGDKVSLFYGKLPCVYINGTLIQNRNILSFVRRIIDNQNDKHEAEDNKMIELIEYTISQQLKNNLEIYYNLDKNDKINNSKKLFKRIKHYFLEDNYFQETASQYLNLNKHNIKENIVENIIQCYNNLFYLLFQKGSLNVHTQNGSFNLIEAYLYSFLKEEKGLFNEVNRPTLQNIKVNQKVNLESFYEFFTSYEKLRKTIKINLKQPEEIMKIVPEFSIKEKTEKKEENSYLAQFDTNSFNKYNLIPLGLFFGISFVIYLIGKRNERNSNENNIKN